MMKPQSLESRDRIREQQDKALADIKLAHEKEGRENFGFETFDGPVLNESEIHARYETMLENLIGLQ